VLGILALGLLGMIKAIVTTLMPAAFLGPASHAAWISTQQTIAFRSLRQALCTHYRPEELFALASPIIGPMLGTANCGT
jgi:hypothetical protein